MVVFIIQTGGRLKTVTKLFFVMYVCFSCLIFVTGSHSSDCRTNFGSLDYSIRFFILSIALYPHLLDKLLTFSTIIKLLSGMCMASSKSFSIFGKVLQCLGCYSWLWLQEFLFPPYFVLFPLDWYYFLLIPTHFLVFIFFLFLHFWKLGIFWL